MEGSSLSAVCVAECLLDDFARPTKISLALPSDQRKPAARCVEPRQEVHVLVADAAAKPRAKGRLVHQLAWQQRMEFGPSSSASCLLVGCGKNVESGEDRRGQERSRPFATVRCLYQRAQARHGFWKVVVAAVALLSGGARSVRPAAIRPETAGVGSAARRPGLLAWRRWGTAVARREAAAASSEGGG